MTKAKLLKNGFYRSYLYKSLWKDFSKYSARYAKIAAKSARNIDWDKETWLHRAGLSTWSPAKRTFGSLSLFVLGGAVGAAVGLLLAPKTGAEIRPILKERATDLLNRAQLFTQSEVPAEA